MTDAVLERILLLLNRKRYLQVEDQIRHVLSERPEDEWALRILAASLIGQARHEDALDAAQRACRAAPEQPLCWAQLANAHIELRQAPAAVAAADRAVSLAPYHAITHFTLAGAYLTQREAYRPSTAHDPGRGLAAADEAVRLAPENAAYRCRRAWALALLDRCKEAEREYRKVLEISPNHTNAVNGLGWVNQRRRPIRAARYYTRALALSPQSEVIKINLKGAQSMWILRLVWVWLWGGLALSLLRWVVPSPVCYMGLVGLGTASLIGSLMLLRELPREAFSTIWAIPLNHFLLLLGRLAGSIGVAVVAASAPPAIAVVAMLLLVVFLLVEWKIVFTDIDQRFSTWVTRS